MSTRLPEWILPLLPRLCCPDTQQALREATDAEREQAGMTDVAALARQDGSRLFPIDDGIPLLLPEAEAPAQ